MRRFFFIRISTVILLMVSLKTVAQNLVLNPSFETVNAGNLQCSWYTTQAQFSNALPNWSCPTGGSSDIMSNALGIGCFCNPNSTDPASYGTENPRTGNVMVGGSLYGTGGCTPYREYFQGTLSSPLVVGTTYKIEFYVSLADKSQVGINNIGLKFATAPVNIPGTMCVYNVVPDVNYTGAPITTKVGWFKIEFCYTATAANMQTFIIGNFFSNAATNTTNVGGTQGNAYYFLDDVSITPSSNVTSPTATFASVCSSPTMTLTGLPAAINYTWTAPAGANILSGVNAQQATVQGNGIYTLTVQDPGGCVNTPATTTVQATVTPPPAAPVITGGGTITCANPTLTLSSNIIAGATYSWSGPGIVSGSNTATIVVNAGGNYVVTATSGACTSSASATVQQNTAQPTVNLTPANTVITCASPTVQLSAVLNPASATFVWAQPAGGTLNNTAITNPVASGNGVFTITVTDPANGCSNNATASLTSGSAPLVLTATGASVCAGASAALTVTGNATSYTWTPAASLNTATSASVTASPGTTTTYTVTGANGACTGSTVVTVTVVPLPNPVVTPASQFMCQGQSATMSVSGGTSYTWSPAASLSSVNAASVTATPAATTIYSVTAETAGCSASAQATVTVLTNPAVTINGNAMICAGDNTILTGQGTNTYTWSPATGLNTTSGSVVTVSPAATTTYTISGSVGTCTASTIITVTVNPLPTLTVSPSQTICAGSSANLAVSGATAYTWSPAASLNTSSAASVSATPAATTSYTVTGSVLGCTNTAVTNVQVDAVPVLTITPAVASICIGTGTGLSASGATSYTWSPSAGLNTVNGASVTANPTLTTIYTITGAALSCTASAQATVTVLNNPTVTVTGNTVICSGANTILTANGAGSYTWSPATGLSTASGSVVTASPASNVTYTVDGSTGTCTNVAYVTVTVTPLPALTISPSQTLCAGNSATLQAGGASSYTWSPASYLSSVSGASVTSTPTANVSYTVSGMASGCTSTLTSTLVVNALPVVSVSPSSPSLCVGGLSNMTAGGATNYTWTPATFLSASGGSNVTASPSVSITYTVQGELLSCLSQTVVTVTVIQNPVLTISPNATICSGSSASLTVSGANFYVWSPMTGLTTSNGINVVAAPSSSSSYTVTGASTAGCTGTISVSVDVVPTPTLLVSASPSAICEGASSSLSAAGAASYTWSPVATLSNITGGMANAAPLVTTVYTVAGTNGVSPYQCTSSRTVEIVVTPTVNLVVPAVKPICFGETTQLQASGANLYSWSPTQGLSSPNQSVSQVKPNKTTTYTVTGSNGNMCTSQATVEIVVNPLPKVYAGADTTINVDESVTLHGTGNVPVEFLTTTSCNFCDAITVNPQERTCYTLRGTSAAGCVAYDDVCVSVTKDWNVYIPNAFTPNGDSENDIFIPVGYGLSQIRLFIFDRWGTQIFAGDENNPGWDGKLKGKVCEQGVYIYQVEIKTMAGNTIKKVGHVTLLGTGNR